jgi:hypothetical protein
MGALVIGTRVGLACVFAVAALSKASPSSFSAFVDSLRPVIPRARRRLAQAVAGSVVAAEACVAVLLLTPVPVAGLAAAVALLALLTGAVVWLVARRRAVTCRCFGPSEQRLGWRHVARNAGLLALAAAALAVELAAERGRVPAAGLATSAAIALSLLNLLLMLAVLRALRELADRGAPTRRTGLPLPAAGRRIGTFAAVDADGARWSANDLAHGARLVAFLDPNCEPCRREKPRLLEAASELGRDRVLAFVLAGEGADVLADELRARVRVAVVERRGPAEEAFGVEAYPTFIASRAGTIVAADHVVAGVLARVSVNGSPCA